MRKIIISIAPVPGNTTEIHIDNLISDINQSIKYGAAMVHLHVREKNGKLTKNLDFFEETINKISSSSDAIIQGSTGGVSQMTIEERCYPLKLKKVEMSSLNGGSTNLGEAVYQNSFKEIVYCAQQCLEKNVLPEIEVFEIGMLNNISLVSEQVKFRNPLIFNIVLGHKGAMPTDIKHLAAFHSFIPKDAMWGITHYGRKNDLSIIAAAISMGASIVRIGFEDSDALINGDKANYNYEIVKQLSELIKSMGFDTASPNEAREMLGLINK